MSDLANVLGDARGAVEEMIRTAEQSGPRWTVPRAPGKWSPSQVVEHVTRAFDESANVMIGTPSRFPRLPALVRPVLRAMFFRRVVRTGSFPKGKTNRAMNPESGAATPAEGSARLVAAFERFDRESRALHATGRPVPSEIFGPVSVEEYARFQAMHTRHHLKQMS